MYAKRLLDGQHGLPATGEPFMMSGSGSTLRTPSQQGRQRRATPDTKMAPAAAGEPQ